MGKHFGELVKALKVLLVVVVLALLSAIADKLDDIHLELERANNMLELQYFEMEWSDETFDQYCQENPDDCEITE